MIGPFGFARTNVPEAPPTPGGKILRLQRPFFYELDVTGLGSGGAAGAIQQVQAGRPFLWVASRWTANSGGSMTLNTQPIPDVLVQLLLQAEPLSPAAVSIIGIAGPPNADPQALVEPFWIAANTTIKANFTNAEVNGDTYTIRLIMIGYQATEEG